MAEVAVRDLRNHGGEILKRVAAGEALTVTRDGEPIADIGAAEVNLEIAVSTV